MTYDQRLWFACPGFLRLSNVPTLIDPAAVECDAVLSDGGTVHIRAINPNDADELVAMHERLSPETQYLRFFTSHPHLSPKEVSRFTTVDFDNRMALVAFLNGQLIAVARYDRSESDPLEAEVAFVVDDRHQGRGLGTLLLEHLAVWARQRGIRRFQAETLPYNHGMQEVFRRAGFVEKSRFEGGVVEVMMDIEPTEALIEAVEGRDHRATVESIRRLLCPASVAVVTAGADISGAGHQVFRNLILNGFAGPVYPVNPDGGSVSGVSAYTSVTEIPGSVDLAVLTVPSGLAADVIRQCAAKKVSSIALLSGEPADSGLAGREREAELLRLARGAGMRVVGPNSVGVINTRLGVSLNASFLVVPPESGPVAFGSQSGGLGLAGLEAARGRGLGISSFVSMGSKADVSSNDLIQYWENDTDIAVILLYLESFGNPRKFARIARRVSRTKPIVTVKAGRTDLGRRRAQPVRPDVALSTDSAVDALFAQAGVVRVDTLAEMFDVALVLSEQPVPAGRKVAIVGNVDAPAIMAADACVAAGLELADLSPDSANLLATISPGSAAFPNPVIVRASAGAKGYAEALRVVLDDPAVDVVLATYLSNDPFEAGEAAQALASTGAERTKPVVAAFVGTTAAPEALDLGSVPWFEFPEPAAKALAHACDYGEWRSRDPGHLVEFPDIDADAARSILADALASSPEGGWLDTAAVAGVLSAYGIPLRRSEPIEGVGVVAGVVHDEAFGPVVMFGTGGLLAEVLGDRAFRILPLTDADASDLVRSIGGAPLMFGFGGAQPVDVAALESVLLRVAQLADDLPAVRELTLDPIVAGASGVVVCDATIRVGSPTPTPDRTLRKLR